MRVWMAPGGLHIEPATPADADGLATLHAEGFLRGWPVNEFEGYLADPFGSPTFLACDARRKPAGFALFRATGDEAELLSITVARRWRGKGVGSALMRAAIEDLQMMPVRRLFLEVEDGNLPALSLYRRLGFATVGRREAYYPKPDGTAAAAHVMQAEIG